MTVRGTIADINSAMNGMSYAPSGNYNGAATLTITTDDRGNSGAGGALSDSDVVNITVNAANDAPVNTVPPAQATNEDTALVFSAGNGNLVSIADVDAAAGLIEVTLTVTNEGESAGQTNCRISRAGDRGTGAAAFVSSPRLASHETRTFSTVVTELGTEPGDLEISCRTP